MSSTSFQRKTVSAKIKILGTKSDGQELLISTGVPTLDECIGGGLAVGSLLLIEEEYGSVYSQLLTKYFIAEGISWDQKVILYPCEVTSEAVLQHIPSAVEKERPLRIPDPASKEPLKIAWRYQQMSSTPNPLGSQTRTFDWNQPVSDDKLSQVSTYTGPSSYCGVLSHLTNELETHSGNNQVLRFVIHGLGSLLWEDEENVLKFLYAVRCLCRFHSATCLMTSSSFWLQQEQGRASQVRHLADVVLHLHTLQENEKQKMPHLKDISGLFYLHRIRRPNSVIARTIHMTRDLAFSVKRKMFTIQKIHLPPAHDETPTIRTTPRSMCSSQAGTSVLEF